MPPHKARQQRPVRQRHHQAVLELPVHRLPRNHRLLVNPQYWPPLRNCAMKWNTLSVLSLRIL